MGIFHNQYGSYRRVFQKLLEFLAYNDSNKPLADTDLDKISEARSMNIIKQDEQLKRDEDENSSDCTKQPVNSQNGTDGSQVNPHTPSLMSCNNGHKRAAENVNIICIRQNIEPVSMSQKICSVEDRLCFLRSRIYHFMRAHKFRMGFQIVLGTALV
ncbi:hypothetical protein Peur_027636 [Populus x canadensis]